MELTYQLFTLHKRVPLTISRGTTAQSTNLWLKLRADGIEGWGEAAPFSIGTHRHPSANGRDVAEENRTARGISSFLPSP